ncbi:solute carrier family 7 member 13-like isoform X1 [Mustela nigripes]|uniref:solute carrier family 7 member 13-like isoform X1 n=1 Tax=Mustela lutreola TaxID=9666 RepID=UPI002797544E|nr:solute carrier family 7 member 13-like isoform X1 [Mustela lutreola]XP_059250783.1 solute carrier family 7 member 13-like isoform X1 [Mustela nigripes]
MQLLRAIGFFHGNILLFCVTTGAGIFVSPKGVLKYSSLNIAVSLSIWAACAVLTMITALSLAEMGTTFPRSGAPYYFLKRSLGSSVAFLSLWIKLFTYPLGIATQSLIISTYLIQPFYTRCPAPELLKKCLALATLWSLGLLNARGVLTVAWFQTISILVKMAVLCFISLTGIVLIGIGKKENVARFEKAFDAELPGVSQIAEAFLQGLFAYSGTSVLINIAGEIKNPGENIPKSLITVLPTVAVIYVLVNISYLAVLTPQEIISTDAVAVTWMDKVIPSMQWVISFGISTSIVSNMCCTILSASRLFYTASQEGQLPLIFSMLNNYFSPTVAITQIIILASFLIISSDLINLIKYSGLATWVLRGLYMIGLLKLRYQEPNLPRPYKVHLPFVLGSIAISLFLILTPMIQSPKVEYIYGFIFIFSGLLCYWLHVHINQHYVCFDKVTCYLQLLFNVSPPEDQDDGISTGEKHLEEIVL